MTRTNRTRSRPPRSYRVACWIFASAVRQLHAVAEFWPPARSFLQ